MNIENLEDFLSKSGIIFLSYVGVVSQDLISHMTESLEKEIEDKNISMSISTNIFTVFIELTQNVMKYSQQQTAASNSKGLVLVGEENNEECYYVLSRNVVNKTDKEALESKLIKITSLSKEMLKQEYKKRRKDNKNMHEKGAGIGLYEIAKRCDKVEYEFFPLDNEHFIFSCKAILSK